MNEIRAYAAAKVEDSNPAILLAYRSSYQWKQDMPTPHVGRNGSPASRGRKENAGELLALPYPSLIVVAEPAYWHGAMIRIYTRPDGTEGAAISEGSEGIENYWWRQTLDEGLDLHAHHPPRTLSMTWSTSQSVKRGWHGMAI